MNIIKVHTEHMVDLASTDTLASIPLNKNVIYEDLKEQEEEA
jgi:hypothetical protein